ncbi:hypothetical protein [Thiocystis violacea]|uniref:hypothetical protein n=1 Tax=Thiocystis violacea TaxID=13725 RepID=UPI001908CBB4|nr:hypothetical protein [Thiocystis violacea]
MIIRKDVLPFLILFGSLLIATVIADALHAMDVVRETLATRPTSPRSSFAECNV